MARQVGREGGCARLMGADENGCTLPLCTDGLIVMHHLTCSFHIHSI